MKHIHKGSLSLLCLSLLLAACSGGGGGGSNSNNAPQNPPGRGGNPQAPAPQSPNPQNNGGYIVGTQGKEGQNKDTRWNANINKGSVPVYNITATRPGNQGKTLFEKTPTTIKVPAEQKTYPGYKFEALGCDGFYGYYFDTDANKDLFVVYGYGFNKDLESKNVPADMTADYVKKDGFLFSVRNVQGIDTSFLAAKADVVIQFKNGKITRGEITRDIREGDSLKNTQLFKVESGNSVNQLVITPTDNLSKGRFKEDKGIAEVHYVDSSKGANDRKYLIGTVDAKGWYGILSAEKN
ncbi:hypothetical protein EDC45_0357 [Mesocricetibacter intestinalis]|uniref:Lipoprotein n=1 Tax=Mesocricetibacter intestinalis TaxID=1521930 RepID=A0A4R6VFY0_9PAST|nr:hypothetical protein [Mesocricetibacter intestinalis]TDQ59699.1 hypothetical protein EDC45_0357 [Mesocricetibacter intestinalis]